MKILITGGTTFVSRFTAEYFVKKGHDVTVINRGSRKQSEGVIFINCDRTQPRNALRGMKFDTVLDITAYNEEHIRGLLQSGISFNDYVLISSSAVYPETAPQPFKENEKCGYNSVWKDYGLNKIKAEEYLISEFPDAYILRPPYFYGLYDNLYREAFVFDCAMQDREFFIPGNGDMKLQFFNVADLCRFIEIILDKKPAQRIFNVGNKETVTVKDWVRMCYNAAGKEPSFISVDKNIFQRYYFCFYDYEYVVDVSEQNQLMPDTVPLYEGIKQEFEWYRRNNPDSVYRKNTYMDYIDNNLKK